MVFLNTNTTLFQLNNQFNCTLLSHYPFDSLYTFSNRLLELGSVLPYLHRLRIHRVKVVYRWQVLFTI